MDDLNFAADFPAPTREDWLKRVEAVLKGADFQKKLVSRTHDGIAIQPLYPKAEGAAPIARAESGRWRVSQRVDHPDPAKASELALLDLEGGADALTLVTRKASAARGFGVGIDGIDDLDRTLSGVMLDLIHLRLDAGGHGRQMAAMLLALADQRGHTLSTLALDLGLDPIGAMAGMGRMSAAWDAVAHRMGDTLEDLTGRGFGGRAFLADGRVYHEAGASEAQELAAVLATGLAYLRALEAHGHSLDAARNALAFLLVADADEFLTVAKLRALRRLWARVEQACGLAPKPIRLHAETAWRMTTRRDPWVNMLRTTVAAFSAGSGGFEALTDALCEKAWNLFQDIEREGGILESLKRNALQERIAAVRAQREKAVATRKEPITGTSEFPNIREAEVAVLLPMPAAGRNEAPAEPPSPAPAAETPFSDVVRMAAEGLPLSRLAGTAAGPAPVAVAPLPSTRTAQGFERLRDLSDAYRAKTGSRPKVFLANLGPVAAFTARSTFAKNFFEAGGIEAVTNEGFSDNDKLREAYFSSKAKLSCICSTDEIYENHAAECAETLRDAGSGPIYLAGRPGGSAETLARSGITTFIYAGCDTLKVLSEALEAACA